MEIHELGALDLARALRGRELSSREIVTALFERADAVDGQVNSLTHRFGEEALAAADVADAQRARSKAPGPLLGLPVTIKESLAMAGRPRTLGLQSRVRDVPTQDAVTVRVLRELGAVVIGQTNVAQALLFHESDNPVYGATKNPWNLDRVPGGSSGGEAAAIAAGITPLGVGTDIGGSIRVPAAFCGISGLKPTSGRWSMVGGGSVMTGQEQIPAVIGPMARSARDVGFLFTAADSPYHARLDPYVPPILTLDPKRLEKSHLRVGYYTTDGVIEPASSVARAVEEAKDALQSAGVTMVPFEPPRSVEMTYLYFASLSSDGGKSLERALEGDPVVKQLSVLRLVAKLPKFMRAAVANFAASQGEARVERLLQAVSEKRIADYWDLARQRNEYRTEVLEACHEAGLDAVLCPPHVTPALAHGQSRDFSLAGSYCMRYNLLNFPAGVVPVTRVRDNEQDRVDRIDRVDETAAKVQAGSAGLPVGVQIAARPYREDVCLALMMTIEQILGGSSEYPKTPVTPESQP